MSDKAVYRAAPATPGLLITYSDQHCTNKLVVMEVILKKKLLPFGHCPKVALAPPLVLDTFGVTFV